MYHHLIINAFKYEVRFIDQKDKNCSIASLLYASLKLYSLQDTGSSA